VYFYELHEGDDDVYSDVILAREEDYPPDDFFDLVQSIRRHVQDTFEESTLIEAIAVELERDHGFIYVSDERIHAAVNVSAVDEENFLVASGDELTASGLSRPEYRSVFLDRADEDDDDRSRLN
jgi:hypothetical protein